MKKPTASGHLKEHAAAGSIKTHESNRSSPVLRVGFYKELLQYVCRLQARYRILAITDETCQSSSRLCASHGQSGIPAKFRNFLSIVRRRAKPYVKISVNFDNHIYR
eukprot:scaffold314998_cov15-Prasinocladus_malaysianus.AAC.1